MFSSLRIKANKDKSRRKESSFERFFILARTAVKGAALTAKRASFISFLLIIRLRIAAPSHLAGSDMVISTYLCAKNGS